MAVVGGEVDIDAEEAELLAYSFADVGAVLPDAGGEDDGIDVAEDHRVSADVLDDAIDEDVHGADAGGIVFGDAVFDDAAVIGDAGEAEEAGLFVDEVVKLVGVHAFGAAEIGEDGGVDVAAARAHAEAFERRESHRGVDGFAALDGRDRGAAAEVAADDVHVLDVAAQEVREAVRDELMGRAVRAVTADVVFRVEFVGNRIEIGVFGDCLMERRVEDGDVRNAGK